MAMISTTYLELTHLPAGDPLVAPDGGAVAAERPAHDDYMRLWRAVGAHLGGVGGLFPPVRVGGAILSSR
jgi:hypothetical protein